jgi:hypothetical protein
MIKTFNITLKHFLGKKKRTRQSGDKQPGGQRKLRKGSDAIVGEEEEQAHVPSSSKEKARKNKTKASKSDEDEEVVEDEK